MLYIRDIRSSFFLDLIDTFETDDHFFFGIDLAAAEAAFSGNHSGQPIFTNVGVLPQMPHRRIG